MLVKGTASHVNTQGTSASNEDMLPGGATQTNLLFAMVNETGTFPHTGRREIN